MGIFELYFLGTSSNIPYDRNHPSVFLRYFGRGILFDVGECVQRQLYKLKLSPSKIDIILITHWHGDHSLGLGGILQSLSGLGVNKKILIIGPKKTEEKVNKLLEVYEFYGNLDLEIKEIDLNPGEEKMVYEDELFYIKAIGLIHTIDNLGYLFIEKDKRKARIDKLKELGLYNNPLVGKLIEGKEIYWKNRVIKPEEVVYVKKGIRIGYLMDTMFFDRLLEFYDNTDIMISECSFIDKKMAMEKKHLSLEDVCKIAKRVKNLYIMHISQRHYKDREYILNYLRKCNKNVYIPNDLEIIK